MSTENIDDKIDTDIASEKPKGERIAKVLARAGIASRREVERMIEEGRVSINGKKLETPAFLVESLTGIKVDGEAIAEVSQTKVWRSHKRRGTLTTHRDPEGRPTVFDNLPDHMGRVISVGRLDMNTEGLLLFTNDGELARWLELPANSVLRRYRVRVHGRVNEKALTKLKDGVTIEGTHYGAIEAELERQQGANAWLTIAIREGKNREVRRVMEHMGLVVNRLIRTHYGPFSLGTLEMGAVAPVGEKQLYEVLDDYFKDAPQSVATPGKKRDPGKWAKAKKPTGNKPGASRKRKFEVFRKGEAGAPQISKPTSGRPHPAAKTDDKEERSNTKTRSNAQSKKWTEKRSGAPQDKTGRPNTKHASARRSNPSRPDADRTVTGRSAKNTGNTKGNHSTRGNSNDSRGRKK